MLDLRVRDGTAEGMPGGIVAVSTVYRVVNDFCGALSQETDDQDQHRLRLMTTEGRIGVRLLFPCQEILIVPGSLSHANPRI